MTPTFQGEILMRRWSDSSTQGVQVTFALSDADELGPLKTKVGKRFACVLVEIADDETPAQPVEPQPKKERLGPLCMEAIDMCCKPDFWKFADVMTEAEAKAHILEVCAVVTRKQLDEIPAAADRFIKQVRIPFFRHMHDKRNPRRVA